MNAETIGQPRILNKIEFEGTTYALVDQLDNTPACNNCIFRGKCDENDKLWKTFARSEHDENTCMTHWDAVWKPVIILSKKGNR